jgi:hypothetical protein
MPTSGTFPRSTGRIVRSIWEMRLNYIGNSVASGTAQQLG